MTATNIFYNFVGFKYSPPIRMKKSKCHFMETSVVYLGHQIDSEGLHATADKVEAIVRAPIPKDVQELRSFLGLVTIGSLFPNFPSLLQPLNSLLQI